MTESLHTPTAEAAADEAALHAFLHDPDGPVGKVMKDELPPAGRPLPTIHKIGEPFKTELGTGPGPTEQNEAILRRYNEVCEYFKDKPLSPVGDDTFKRMIIDKLVGINAAYVLGVPHDVPPGRPGADLAAQGITGILANNLAARDAVERGIDLNGEGDD